VALHYFKSTLDKYWSNQHIIYDFRTEIQVTGSRCEVTVRPRPNKCEFKK